MQYTSPSPMQGTPKVIQNLLLQQWQRLTLGEIESTHYVKHSIARLIERKYGINSRLMENYLSNLERTLPLMA